MAHVCESLFRPPAIGNVDTYPDVANERAILIKPRHSKVENPSIFSVVPSEPILRSELFLTIERLHVCIRASTRVLGVDPLRPAVPELDVNRSPGEVQPRLIEVVAELVGV
jgi:hypothetical protein